MKIKELNQRSNLSENIKVEKAFTQFDQLLTELRRRKLPDHIVAAINQEIETINSIPGAGNDLKKQIKKSQKNIITRLEKELKLVPKHYYRSTWMALGMAAFGLPLGAAFAFSIGNMAFLGIGLPLGMIMGMAFGSSMDDKAFKEGRQLNFEFS